MAGPAYMSNISSNIYGGRRLVVCIVFFAASLQQITQLFRVFLLIIFALNHESDYFRCCSYYASY